MSDFDVDQLNEVSQDVNLQLIWYKIKLAEEQMHSRAMEDSLGLVSRKLRINEEANRLIRERTILLHDETNEQMDYLEQFVKDHLKVIQNSRFDKLLEEARIRVHQVYSTMDTQMRDEKLEEMKEFEKQWEEFKKSHEEKISEMMNRHLREETEMEARFNTEFSQLMAKYTPKVSSARL
ncbi:ribonuclease P [Artemisia annua]|uniref:Ribonuclease P n=1 Tax=Artemisia annua TaxID=35608 RepID=A0A2U1KSP2_ARTAN|nr:ribonuclease P [Artemisia annua]